MRRGREGGRGRRRGHRLRVDGNTAASAAAYAARAGLTAVVLMPAGAIAAAKLGAVARGRREGARGAAAASTRRCRAASSSPSAARYALVNSLNPHRIEGQKTAAFEIGEELGRAPDVLALPYGGGGNTVAYAKGFAEDGRPAADGLRPGRRARDTLASAIRIAEPAHLARGRRARRRRPRRASSRSPTTRSRAAWLEIASREGVFCEPSSAAGLAGAGAARSSSRAARSSACSPATA